MYLLLESTTACPDVEYAVVVYELRKTESAKAATVPVQSLVYAWPLLYVLTPKDSTPGTLLSREPMYITSSRVAEHTTYRLIKKSCSLEANERRMCHHTVSRNLPRREQSLWYSFAD